MYGKFRDEISTTKAIQLGVIHNFLQKETFFQKGNIIGEKIYKQTKIIKF